MCIENHSQTTEFPNVSNQVETLTFYVGTLKGVGRVYQQTYVDTYSKIAHAKLYTTKMPITAADMLNECEACLLYKAILQEFYQVTFRKKIYEDIETLQADLDEWINRYNNERTHQGKMCCTRGRLRTGRTPFETMIEGKEIWKEKYVDQT